jgi:folate-binding protein YgfZ
VPSEYDSAREHAALTHLPERGVLAVTGPLRQKFLHNILSNVVEGLGPGEGRLASLMDNKGHVLAFLRVLVSEGEVLLETAGDRLPLVEERLAFYRVAAPVRFARRPTAVLALLGPRARDVLRAAGAEVPALAAEESHAAVALGGGQARVVRAGDLPAEGLVLHVAPETAAEVEAALLAAGASRAGREVLDALRIEEGLAWYGSDVTEENLLHETGQVARYHSPTKGCYVGQETVARLEARGGNVNKRLRGLRLTTAAAAGAPLRAGEREVGRITTAAVSPRHGPIALAYVQRGAGEPGSALQVEGGTAVVEALPFPAAGVAAGGARP